MRKINRPKGAYGSGGDMAKLGYPRPPNHWNAKEKYWYWHMIRFIIVRKSLQEMGFAKSLSFQDLVAESEMYTWDHRPGPQQMPEKEEQEEIQS